MWHVTCHMSHFTCHMLHVTCLKPSEDFFSLSVWQFVTLIGSVRLIVIVYNLVLYSNGRVDLWRIFSAKSLHNLSLLTYNESRLRSSRDLLYAIYLFATIILVVVFWTLSISCLLASVRLVCHTTALCSSTLLIYEIYMVFKSAFAAPNSESFLRRITLALALLTICEVLLSHFMLFSIMVPRSFCFWNSFYIFSIWFYSGEKLIFVCVVLVFILSLFINILFFFVQLFMKFEFVCDFKWLGLIFWLCVGTSFGTWAFKLWEDIPMVRKLTISKMVRSTTNLNRSSGLTQFALSFDWLRYSNSQRVAPAGPPPGKLLGFDSLVYLSKKRWFKIQKLI